MTEAGWLACAEPDRMLYFLREKESARKLRLFGCACCRSLWQWLDDERCQRGIEAAECFADNSEAFDDLLAASSNSLRAMEDAAGDSENDELGQTKWHAAVAVVHITEMLMHWFNARDASVEARQAESCHQFEAANPGVGVPFPEPEPSDGTEHAALVRDIFGNPFRPMTFDPSWRTTTATQLAQQMYDSRDFSAMPILADALQDAGCDNTDILDHCRGPEPHVRGCWVVDLVLGKE